ncbi:MAG: hypothetical protein H0W02_05195 [Ktedonobacteraceae bacterium]|nr:hypothetical protein [Ktedonobacteraceae bacterium]
MLCPRCGFENGLSQRRCARCGFELTGKLADRSSRGGTSIVSRPAFPAEEWPIRDEVLHDGRYRLLNQISLPEVLQKQGRAWSALDLKDSQRRVVVRELPVPREMGRGATAERAAHMAAQRLAELGQHPGFPRVLDFFAHGGSFFLVFLYPEGESLASLLNRQRGALPEQIVAGYGYQLCGLLALMADQQPPVVHGSITPDTILVSEDKQNVCLIYLPPFGPDATLAHGRQRSVGHYAPEQQQSDNGPASDLSALAVTLYQAVTGYDPRARLAMFHPPARRLNPAVTPQMEMILARQLSLTTSQRYLHPSEMQKDLAALLESYPDSTENQTLVQTLNPLELSATQLREQSHSAMLLDTGVIVAICVLVLVVTLFVILR